MIIELFTLLAAISVALIIVGLVRTTESAQALVGFFFLFLLSFVLMSGSLEYRTGTNVSRTEIVNGSTTTVSESQLYTYTPYNASGYHNFGYYLALASVAGMVGVLASLKGGWNA